MIHFFAVLLSVICVFPVVVFGAIAAFIALFGALVWFSLIAGFGWLCDRLESKIGEVL